MICSVVFVVTSLVTPGQDPKRLDRYCWGNPLAAITDKPLHGFLDPRVLSIVLLLVMAVCYYYFR